MLPRGWIEKAIAAFGRRSPGVLAVGCACLLLLCLDLPAAKATILPPSTIDGPSTEIVGLGGVAMASDGTGGLVYVKTVEGTPHIFASRYTGSQWGPPIRVDREGLYPASQPAIAAGPGGRLMVVWVTPVATLVSDEVRDGLYSAMLGPGSSAFGPQLLVDPNVGKGIGVDPSLAGAAPGKAIVAYRAITKTFGPFGGSSAAQLRPGDVLADIRVARLEGDRWSRLGAINRNSAASMRPPTEDNGPKVAIGASGRAVVAWQEPDQTGAARAWMRRIDGTTVGPVLSASPEAWEGHTVLGDVTALTVSVSAQDRARVAAQVEGSATSPTGGGRIFLTSLGSSSSPEGGKPTGPDQVEAGSSAAPIGPPDLSVADGTGAEGSMLLGYSAGSSVRTAGVDHSGDVEPPTSPPGPPAERQGPVVATVDAEGGGTLAYETEVGGTPGVAVRQEVPGGATQTGLLYGPLGGPVSQLAGQGTESGDALLAFTQGEGGRFAVEADRIASAPGRFAVLAPKRWVRPGRARIRWSAAPSGVGGLTYSVLLDGQAIGSGLTSLALRPPRGVLGSGVNRIRVLATDRLGDDTMSSPAKLRVDSQPPRLRAKVESRRGVLALLIRDSQSGLQRGSIRVSFGDGTHAHGRPRLHHLYERPGRYLVRVRASDRVHNRLVQKFRVAVR